MTASHLRSLPILDKAPCADGRAPDVSVVECGTLTIHSWCDDHAQCVALLGELDMACAPELERVLRRVDARSADSIVLDLSALEFIDSSGIAAIVYAHRHWGHRLVLLRGPHQVHRVFELTGLDRALPFANG